MEEVPSMGIMCAETVCKEMRFCTECFSLGAELGPHKTTHRYKFFHSGRMEPATPRREAAPCPASIISTRAAATEGSVWYEEEEVRLLKGLELYGHGNWSEISNFISTKTAQEAKEEYNHRYVDGVIGQLTWGTLEVNPDALPIDHTIRPHPPLWPDKSTEAESDDDEPEEVPNKKLTVPMGPLSPSLTSKLPQLEVTKEEMRLLGVMPKRDDYEKEWENDAEQLVSNISFDSDDDEVDLGMKFALIDMYATKVRERAKRKRIVREYQLVAEFFRTHKVQQACANKGPLPAVAGTSATSSIVAFTDHPVNEVPGVREQIDLYRKKLAPRMRPFIQFFAAKKDFDTLVNNLVMEEELKLRLYELYKYRRLGFTKFTEIYDYEQKKEEASKNEKLKKDLEPLTESENEGTTVGEGDEQSEENGEDEEETILEEIPKPRGPTIAELEEEDSDDFELLSVGNTSDAGRVTPDYFQNYHHVRVVTPLEKNKKRPASSLAKARKGRKRKPKTKRFFRQKSHTPQIIEMRRKLKLQKERVERKKKKSANQMEPQLTTTRSGRVAKKLSY